jgi:hypothetical protein
LPLSKTVGIIGEIVKDGDYEKKIQPANLFSIIGSMFGARGI